MTQSTIIEVAVTHPSDRVFAVIDGKEPIAVLCYDGRLDALSFIGVAAAHRRRGLATDLLQHARRVTGAPIDIDDGARSPAGAAFTQARGIARGPMVVDLSAEEMEEHLSSVLGDLRVGLVDG